MSLIFSVIKFVFSVIRRTCVVMMNVPLFLLKWRKVDETRSPSNLFIGTPASHLEGEPLPSRQINAIQDRGRQEFSDHSDWKLSPLDEIFGFPIRDRYLPSAGKSQTLPIWQLKPRPNRQQAIGAPLQYGHLNRRSRSLPFLDDRKLVKAM